MYYLDLFAGIGGFALGIRQVTNNKWKCIGFSEIETAAINIYKYHFKDHINYGNARTIQTRKLPDFDLLCAGFPCQSFSIAGKRLGLEDTRGTLFFEIARICRDKRPRYILLENVQGLLVHKSGKTFQSILRVLADIGYILQYQVCDSRWFTPQHRERVYIIGCLGKESFHQIFPLTQDDIGSISRDITAKKNTFSWITGVNDLTIMVNQSPTLRKTQARKVLIYEPFRDNVTYPGKRHKTGINDTPMAVETRNKVQKTLGSGEDSKNKQGILGEEIKTEQTKRHQGGWNIEINGMESYKDLEPRCKNGKLENPLAGRIRYLTPLECERLQGFPDEWTNVPNITENKRYECIGNSVTVPIIRIIINKMKNVINI